MTTLARTHVAARRSVPPFDFILVIATLLVSAVGVVMVYTATRGSLLAAGGGPQDLPEEAGPLRRAGRASPWWWWPCSTTGGSNRWPPSCYWLIVLALLGVFAVGSSAQGAARWFSVGPLQLQPSEFAVLALILAVASYCARRDEEGLAWRDVFRLLDHGRASRSCSCCSSPTSAPR